MKSSYQFSSKRIFFLTLLTPLLFSAGMMGLGALNHCSKTGGQAGPGPGPGGSTCTASQLACGSSCVDIQSDAANCGACSNACSASQVCSKGSCKTACDSGLTTCASSCVDVTQDAANCGACGHVCNANQVCTAGSCTFQIPAAQIQTAAVSRVERTIDNVEGKMSIQRTTKDSQGNVYITGHFNGTVTLGDKTISCNEAARDPFVAKIGLNGQVIWAKNFKNQFPNDSFESAGEAIAVDAQGNVYVGGYFEGKLVFNDKIKLTSSELGANYTTDAFLTKLDANGAVVWAAKYGEATGSYWDRLIDVTVDQEGSVIALARYYESVGLGSQTTLAIIKYSAATIQDGTATWFKTWNITNADLSDPKLITDAQGNIIILLDFSKYIETGSSDTKLSKLESAKDGGSFITSRGLVKLARDTGLIQWVNLLVPYDPSSASPSVLLGSQGRLVMMGDFKQGLNFGADDTGNSIKISAPLENKSDIYWSTWNLTTGKPIAAHALGGNGNKEILSVTADPQGNVLMSSYCLFEAFSFGSTGQLQSMGDYNFALVKLDDTGKPLWAERVNDDGLFVRAIDISSFEVIFDTQNAPWFFFNFKKTLSMGGGTKLTPKGNLFDFGFTKLKP